MDFFDRVYSEHYYEGDINEYVEQTYFGELQVKEGSRYQQHPFHVLGSSRLPMFMAAFAGGLAITLIMKLHGIYDFANFSSVGGYIMEPLFSLDKSFRSYKLPDSDYDSQLVFFLVLIVLTMWSWAREVIIESVGEGRHTLNVQIGLGYGMLLFLASEAMLFFPFFWSFFHFSLSPSVAYGTIWPPVGIREVEALDPFMLPFVNTVVLLTSGVALVWSHRAIIVGRKQHVVNGLFIAVSLGILFSWLQYLEYGLTKYTITDGVFGSTFFLLTGLHGFHVIVGTCLLLISYWRATRNQFSRQHHAFFEFAAWYWHFVDVVWLFVFVFIYYWGVDEGLYPNLY